MRCFSPNMLENLRNHNAECTYSRIQEPEFSLSFIYLFFVTLLLTLYLVRMTHDRKNQFYSKIYQGQK